MNDQNCIICASEKIKDTTYTYKCINCNLFTSNLSPGFGREIEGIDNLRIRNSKKIISKMLLYKNIKKLKVFEFGSGQGYFINEAEKLNIDITGSDPDETEYNILKNKYKKIIKISLPISEEKKSILDKYDYIVFNDVFEHLNDLNKITGQLKNFLKPGGCLVINIPSSDGILFKVSRFLYNINIHNIYNRLWQKNTSSPHLTYFNNKNLSLYLKRFDYELIHSGSLDFIDNVDNFKRLNSINKNKLYCYFFSSLLFVMYYIQKFLPKDVMLHIYQIKNY